MLSMNPILTEDSKDENLVLNALWQTRYTEAFLKSDIYCLYFIYCCAIKCWL